MRHLSLGSCRYADFKAGDLVELSIYGWDAGLAVNYAYTFGRVVNFSEGILTVLREGTKRAQSFHPCYWLQTTKEEVDELREEQRNIGMIDFQLDE